MRARHQADEGLEAWLGRPPVLLFALDDAGVCTLLVGRGEVLGLASAALGRRLADLFIVGSVVAEALDRALTGEAVSTVAALGGEDASELRLFPRRDGGVDGVAVRVQDPMAYAIDDVTGLAGRGLLFDRARLALRRLARSGGRVMALAVRLDRFGLINETWGYDTGDLLLAQVAR